MQALLQYQKGEPDALYGDVRGSAPNWASCNLHDRGKAHVQTTPSLLADTKLSGWLNLPPAEERTSKRTYEPRQTACYAEPVVFGVRSSAYYERRAQTADYDYRRSMRFVPDPGTLRVDRPEGKRYVPEPKPPGPAATGLRTMTMEREPGRAPEPALPRLGRPPGVNGLRESDQELCYEQAFGRKIRVDQNTYRGLGRAGDVSTGTYGPKPRPEDDPMFFKTLKDTPTFIRFCNSLPSRQSLPVSSHERRRTALKRDAERERDLDRKLVSTLDFPIPRTDDD